jgi:hypothetical protein
MVIEGKDIFRNSSLRWSKRKFLTNKNASFIDPDKLSRSETLCEYLVGNFSFPPLEKISQKILKQNAD